MYLSSQVQRKVDYMFACLQHTVHLSSVNYTSCVVFWEKRKKKKAIDCDTREPRTGLQSTLAFRLMSLLIYRHGHMSGLAPRVLLNKLAHKHSAGKRALPWWLISLSAVAHWTAYKFTCHFQHVSDKMLTRVVPFSLFQPRLHFVFRADKDVFARQSKMLSAVLWACCTLSLWGC